MACSNREDTGRKRASTDHTINIMKLINKKNTIEVCMQQLLHAAS
jgi:hypothetical protein